MTEGVKVFLSQLGMTRYYDMFITKGFDLESDIPYLTSYDLEEVLMVSSQEDRSVILSHACTFRPSPEHAVYEWLRSNSLDYYFISFVQSELTDLATIAQLTLPNEDLYDELEIILPGHRKRLERAVEKLKQEKCGDVVVENPVSFGWWGKPLCLPQAKFDFLCVKAFVFAAHNPVKKACIDFMVDSGSDVSTVQEDTLRELNLELIGPVYSCGIHGGNHTNLYKARLRIGDQEMDIEVMGSNYDSLGSRVVRHFRHIIDGRRHVWLKGNYGDHLPAITSAVLSSVSGQKAGPSLFSNLEQSSGQRALPSPTLLQDSLENSHKNSVIAETVKVVSLPNPASVNCSTQLNKTNEAATDSVSPNTESGSVLQVSQRGEGLSVSKHHGTSESDAVTALSSQHLSSIVHTSISHQSQKSAPSQNKVKNQTQSKSAGMKVSSPPNHSVHNPPESLPDSQGNQSLPSHNDNSGTSSSSNALPVPEQSAASERVSLKNWIPPHLRDTNDDIDSLDKSAYQSLNHFSHTPQVISADKVTFPYVSHVFKESDNLALLHGHSTVEQHSVSTTNGSALATVATTASPSAQSLSSSPLPFNGLPSMPSSLASSKENVQPSHHLDNGKTSVHYNYSFRGVENKQRNYHCSLQDILHSDSAGMTYAQSSNKAKERSFLQASREIMLITIDDPVADAASDSGIRETIGMTTMVESQPNFVQASSEVMLIALDELTEEDPECEKKCNMETDTHLSPSGSGSAEHHAASGDLRFNTILSHELSGTSPRKRARFEES